jgi:hypothetical protein
MKRSRALYKSVSAPVRVTSALLALLIGGCGGGGGGGSSGNGTADGAAPAAVSLKANIKNVPLIAGVPAQIVGTYTLSGNGSTGTGDYSINLARTLENTTLSSSPVAGNGSKFETLRLLAYVLVKEVFAAENFEVTAYVSHQGDPNVCSSPYFFGPFSVVGAVGSALTSGTTTLEPSQEHVDIVSAGSYDVCVVMTPPITAYLTVTELAVDVKPCASPTVDIVGAWSGTYQCENTDGSTETGGVSLTVTQNPDGSYHYADDGGAAYDGHLCGNKFKFKGGKAGAYRESGTLIANGSVATKTSIWRGEITNTSGRCTDNLSRS